MNHADYVNRRKGEVVAIARLMLKREKQLIEGVRQICAIRADLDDPDDAVFLALRAVESETDAFPLGQVRNALSADHLCKTDSEMEQYLAAAEPDIRRACEQLIERLAERNV